MLIWPADCAGNRRVPTSKSLFGPPVEALAHVGVKNAFAGAEKETKLTRSQAHVAILRNAVVGADFQARLAIEPITPIRPTTHPTQTNAQSVNFWAATTHSSRRTMRRRFRTFTEQSMPCNDGPLWIECTTENIARVWLRRYFDNYRGSACQWPALMRKKL